VKAHRFQHQLALRTRYGNHGSGTPISSTLPCQANKDCPVRNGTRASKYRMLAMLHLGVGHVLAANVLRASFGSVERMLPPRLVSWSPSRVFGLCDHRALTLHFGRSHRLFAGMNALAPRVWSLPPTFRDHQALDSTHSVARSPSHSRSPSPTRHVPASRPFRTSRFAPHPYQPASLAPRFPAEQSRCTARCRAHRLR
jgi:hypothetical protein